MACMTYVETAAALGALDTQAHAQHSREDAHRSMCGNAGSTQPRRWVMEASVPQPVEGCLSCLPAKAGVAPARRYASRASLHGRAQRWSREERVRRRVREEAGRGLGAVALAALSYLAAAQAAHAQRRGRPTARAGASGGPSRGARAIWERVSFLPPSWGAKSPTVPPDRHTRRL